MNPEKFNTDLTPEKIEEYEKAAEAYILTPEQEEAERKIAEEYARRNTEQEGGVSKDDSEKSIAELYEEAAQERLKERIDSLFRFVGTDELASYFGQGETYEEKVKNAMDNPTFWWVILGEKADEELITFLETHSEGKEELIEWIKKRGEVDFDDLVRYFGLPKKHNEKLYSINPTRGGFGVNAPAMNYKQRFLIEVRLDERDLKVKDLGEDIKTVIFEPTYTSTPRIHLKDFRVDNTRKPKVIEFWGSIKDGG